jgi:type I restriction-modification system DNA methylase subunit
MDKEHAKEEVRFLVEKYNRIVKEERDIKSKEEERTKKDLIRPLFERVLGWNFEEDVTAEEKISKGWVDYGFRINGVPKFFLEAKAFTENLDNPKFFEQAVNYAYYKRCPWAVLTNFETLKILNAEWETPNYYQSRFMTINCNEFLDKFEDLWLLSKSSFEQSALDKVADKYGKLTKKASVDKQLLNDFTRFRDMLSKNVTKRNPEKKLTQTELDESIQRILDRLIFIRNCEDRGLEEKKLWEARNETKVWKQLKEVFAYYDKNYDSKLFTYDLTDPRNLHLCDRLDIDDSVMREIIESLYRTKDKSISYDFSIIDADVLGTVYEQYLSHILKKSEKRATLKENQAHRKEQGVYYTPTYIVDYIVRATLGELLNEKNVDAERIKVIDPACGSGSFLIKAFDVFNEHYLKNDKDYSQTQLDLKSGKFTRKVKILHDNIFGVDLDRQAVEIAQLNLLLKIAEKGHRLPLLEQNIKSGNSLIDDKEIAKDKAFDWKAEFKDIMSENGFDVVIGNPPYVESRDIEDDQWDYYRKKYSSAHKRFDLSVLFLEKAIEVLKNHGLLGVIISNKFTASDYGYGIRKHILDNCKIKQIIDVSNIDVFRDASTYPYIMLLQKELDEHERENNIIEVKKVSVETELRGTEEFSEIVQGAFMKSANFIFSLDFTQEVTGILEKMNSVSKPLDEICEMKDGIHTGNVREKLILDEKKNEGCKKLITAESINRYSLKWNGLWVDYRKEVINKDKGEYGSLRNPRIFEASEKLFTALFGLRPEVAYDDGKLYANNSVKIILARDKRVNLKCVMALLNSKLMMFYYRTFFASTHVRGGYIQFYPQDFLRLPVKELSEIEQTELTKLVDKMLSLNERLNELGDKKTDERIKLESEIENTDSEIDDMAYKVYGIAENERKIIEKSLNKH